jgi:hypothetical protein
MILNFARRETDEVNNGNDDGECENACNEHRHAAQGFSGSSIHAQITALVQNCSESRAEMVDSAAPANKD